MNIENSISVSGKQTKVGKSLTSYVKENLTNTLKKYFANFLGSSVIFSKDSFNFKCDININIEGSIFIKGSSQSNDAYGAFNVANEKIKKRIRRYHRKLIAHRTKSSKSIKNLKASQYIIKNPDIKNVNVDEPVIIAESDEMIKTVSVSEALMLMNLNDQNAIFFKNVKSKRLNILFKREDGNIGWLDPKNET